MAICAYDVTDLKARIVTSQMRTLTENLEQDLDAGVYTHRAEAIDGVLAMRERLNRALDRLTQLEGAE